MKKMQNIIHFRQGVIGKCSMTISTFSAERDHLEFAEEEEIEAA
jgi:hypothetical protein